MNLSYKFKKDSMKIMDRDVNVVVIIENPIADFDADMHFRYRWDITVKFYLHRKFKLLPTRFDREYYHYCYTDTKELKQDLDIIKLIQDCCKLYEQEAINKQNICQLQQRLNDWDGSFEVENKEIE